MGLGLTPLERLARARSDLRMGAAVALRDGGGAALVLAAETATAERLDDLRALRAGRPRDDRPAGGDAEGARLRRRPRAGGAAGATPTSTGCGRRPTPRPTSPGR